MSLEIQNGGFLNSESYKPEEFWDEIAYFDERCEMQIPRFYDFIGDPKFEKYSSDYLFSYSIYLLSLAYQC